MSIIATTAPEGVADELLFQTLTEITEAGHTPILIGRRPGWIRSRRGRDVRMVVDGNLITARGDENVASACRALGNRIVATRADAHAA